MEGGDGAAGGGQSVRIRGAQTAAAAVAAADDR